PVADWVRAELDDWLAAAAIDRGRLFRRVNKVGRTWGDGMTVKAVWHIVKESARSIGVAKLAPHDLRRTCARLRHASGGELEQIQFLLGHVSVQTTERRSEEHTSELQSRGHLVCRLLLEKKKNPHRLLLHHTVSHHRSKLRM